MAGLFLDAILASLFFKLSAKERKREGERAESDIGRMGLVFLLPNLLSGVLVKYGSRRG